MSPASPSAAAESAPDALGSALLAITAPAEEFVPLELQGQKVVGVAGMWCGDAAEGAERFAPLRALDPELDLMASRPYAEFQSMIDDEPGHRHYWSADYHVALPDKALDLFLAGAADPAARRPLGWRGGAGA